MVRELDTALAHYATVLRRDLSVDVADAPGAGAELVPGARLVLDALDFAARVAGADLVLTAEGQLDAQTAYGKSVGAVAQAARAAGARVIALAGRVAASDDDLAALGIDAALAIADGPLTLAESMARAAELLEDAAARALRLVAVGQVLGPR